MANPDREGRPDGAQAVRLDPAARARVLARLLAAPQPPWLHGEVARRMAERLQIVRQVPQQVVDWSGKLGAGSAVLRAAYPKAQRIEVLQAEAAGAASRPQRWWTRLAPASARTVAAADVPDGAAQLVWSNMALHFSAAPAQLMRAWHRALAPEGFLMFSTLGPGSLERLREAHARLGAGPAHAPFIDMHDLGDDLVRAGFADPVMDQEQLTLTYADADSLLADLRSLGGNMDPLRHPGLRTPRWRARWAEALTRGRDTEGRLALGFEIVYGHAFRAVGPQVTAETAVSLGEMKAMLHRRGGGSAVG